MKTEIFVALISVFYIVGLGLLGYGLWSAWRSTEAAHWPTAAGAVTQIALNETPGSADDGPTYEVKVEYTYTVAGTEYRGSRVAFGYSASGDRASQAEIHDKLKAAKSVDVRYDPADPATSALSFGIHRSIRFFIVFAVTWLAFVFGFTLIWWVSTANDGVLLQNISVQ